MLELPLAFLRPLALAALAAAGPAPHPLLLASRAGFELEPHPLGAAPEWLGSTAEVVAFEPHRDLAKLGASVRRGLARALLLRSRAPHVPADVAALAALLAS